MSVGKAPGPAVEAVAKRHRSLVALGAAGVLAGVLLAAYVGYEWFVAGVSHEVIAILAASVTLLGVQVLVFTSLSDMVIALHEERLRRAADERDGEGDDGDG